MHITHVDVFGLKYLLRGVAKINRIEMTPNATVQIIIGTNGSGKSRLLDELTVLPAKRDDYVTNGYRKITAVNNTGIEYLITADFSNKSSAHSLIRLEDGIELNPGGTEEAQKDLIASIFGIDKYRHDLLCHRTAVSAMKAAERKDWLVTLNPIDLRFIFDNLRHTQRQIKACKNQLTMLIDRKASLEADLLDPALLESLQIESQTLTNEIARLVEYGHRLAERIAGLGDIKSLDEPKLQQLITQYHQLIRTIRRKRRHYDTIVNQTSAIDELQVNERTVVAIDATIIALEDQGRTLAEEIARYHTTLRQLLTQNSLQEIDLAIQTLTQEIQTLQVRSDPHWSDAMIATTPGALNTLRELCSNFLGLSGVLFSRSTYTRKQHAIQYHSRRLAQLDREINQLEQQLDTKRRATQAYALTHDIDPCAKARCPLYQQYVTRRDSVHSELEILSTQLCHKEHLRARTAQYVTAQAEQLLTTTTYGPQISQIMQILHQSENVHLRQALSSIDVVTRLQSSPMSLIAILEAIYADALKCQRRRQCDQELLQHIQKREAAQVVGENERATITALLAEKEAALRMLHTHLDRHITQKMLVLRQNQTISVYLADVAELARLGQEIDALLNDCQRSYDLKQLKHLHHTLQEYQRDAVKRLSTIDRTLRDQYTLRERHTHEVLDQIEIIEALKRDLQLIEPALVDIPQRYIIRFLNSVLHTANRIIKEVFTYPLAYQLHAEDKPLTYAFPVKNSGDLVPDVSACSTAQKAMLNFAFNCGMIVQLGLTDYPVMLDEIGEGFDHHHEQRLIQLLGKMAASKQFSQLFLVNHHAIVHGGLANTEVLVLDDSNVLTPSTYNTHTVIEKI